jgi:hypothetical protein
MLGILALLAAATIPTYPGAVKLCSQHVAGAPIGGQRGPHITWTAYYTTDAPDVVVAWYQRRLPGLHRREGREDVFRVPADRPEAVVSITPVADAPPPVASCSAQPPAAARTIVLMSAVAR